MYFCVLLTTQGRLNYLERLFESLLHQTYRNFFVLLGDQSAEGELDALLSRYEKNFRIDRHILPQLSLSAARNALLPFVEGDYIYFSDDDSYLAPSTFAIMAQYARKWPRAGALIGSGQSKPGLEKPCAGSLPSRELSAYSVFRNCPSWCIFVKKDVPQLIGFFDENNIYTYPPELDMAIKIWCELYKDKDIHSEVFSHTEIFNRAVRKLGFDLRTADKPNGITEADNTKRIRRITTPQQNKDKTRN